MTARREDGGPAPARGASDGSRSYLALGGAVLIAGVGLALGEAGVLAVDWGWALALACACGGGALLAIAPASRALYAGVFARFAPHTRERWALRAATVLAAPLAGIGPAAYALLALGQALTLEPSESEPRLDWRRVLATGLLGLAFVLAARELGLTLGSDELLWPVLAGSTALAGFWWLSGPSAEVRRVLGALTLFFLLLYGSFAAGTPDRVVIGAGIGAAVVLITLAPRWLRNSRVRAAERARLARSEERAEVAGAVHDSVLQTLALIQSRAEDPAEVRALARTQERELRARLFGTNDDGSERASTAGALRAVAAEVEDAHRTKIEVVIVGDAPLDERATALVAAAREALLNSVRHAPGAPVSLFAEVDEQRVEAFVRDRGPGFDLEAVPSDRRGVTDSIVGRMVRHGGHAAVRTAPGGGCEVRLVLERGR